MERRATQGGPMDYQTRTAKATEWVRKGRVPTEAQEPEFLVRWEVARRLRIRGA
jgi:hypothetical protein